MYVYIYIYIYTYIPSEPGNTINNSPKSISEGGMIWLYIPQRGCSGNRV